MAIPIRQVCHQRERQFAEAWPAAQAVGHPVAAQGHGHRSDQEAVWSEVDRQMQSLKSSSETHAMSDTYDSNRYRFQEFRTHMSYTEGATGLAVAIGSTIVSVSTSSTSRPPAARSGTACFPGSSWMPSRKAKSRSPRHRPRWMRFLAPRPPGVSRTFLGDQLRPQLFREWIPNSMRCQHLLSSLGPFLATSTPRFSDLTSWVSDLNETAPRWGSTANLLVYPRPQQLTPSSPARRLPEPRP